MIHLLFSAFALLFMVAPLPASSQLCLNNDFYENRTASMKFGFLWDAIRESDRETARWFTPTELIELFTESQEPTISHKSDFFPAGRKKFIHTVGAIAQCEFNFEDDEKINPYTGLFKSGSNYALCRGGSSTQPTNTTITPGFAFKLLRNRVHSANIFAMYQLDPQKTGGLNFFKNVLVNHLAARLDLPATIVALGKRFQTVSKWPTLVGLSDVARWDQRGREVAHPKYPFALVFQPNPALTRKFDNWGRFDVENYFPREFHGNEILYQIYAVPDAAEPPRLIPIGNVKLRSKFYPSKFADQQLFFKHQRIEEDLVQHPEWTTVLANTTRVIYEGADFYSPFLPKFNCRDRD